MNKIRIVSVLLLLASVASAVSLPSFGSCTNLTLFNATSNSSYIGELCNPYPNLGINLTLNASDSAARCYSNSTFGVYACAVGNETTIMNNTINETVYVNVTPKLNLNLTLNASDPATRAYHNETLNFTVTAVGNSTTTIYQNVSACNFTAAVTPTASDQIFTNVSGLSVTVRAIPQNYCYRNVYRNPIGYGEVYRDDFTNTTIIGAANYTTVVSSPVCPSGQYCQPPPQTCQVCQQCQNCTAAVTATRNECESQLAASSGRSEELARQAQENGLELQSARSEKELALNMSVDAKNSVKEARKDAEQARADRDFVVKAVLAAGTLIFIIGTAMFGYNIIRSRKSRLPEAYPPAMKSGQYDDLLKSGGAIIIKEGEKK